MSQITHLLQTGLKFRNAYDLAMKPLCARHGLTRVELVVIGFLHNNAPLDTASDICRLRMELKSTVSTSVEHLIRRGLLTREQDADDRRIVHLHLTPQCAPILADIESSQQAFIDRIRAGFTPDQLNACCLMMKTLSENLDRQLT